MEGGSVQITLTVEDQASTGQTSCISVSNGGETVQEALGPVRLACSLACARIGCIAVPDCHGDDHLGSLAVLL